MQTHQSEDRLARKPKSLIQSAHIDAPIRPPSNDPVQRVLQLQQTIGNQRTTQLLQGQGATVQRKLFTNTSKRQTLGSDRERRYIPDSGTKAEQEKKTYLFDKVENVTIQSGEHNLTGLYFAPQTHLTDDDYTKYNGKTVLFLSGSGGSAEEYGEGLARFYCGRGAAVLAVNYRGFGGSTKGNNQRQIGVKDIDEAGINADARAMFDYLQNTRGTAPGDVIVHGYSLGGAVASKLVADLGKAGIRVGGLVMHSPIDSVRDQAKNATQSLHLGRGLGAKVAEAGGLEMDTLTNLIAIAGEKNLKNLPIHFMSGSEGLDADGDISEDQLALDQTDLLEHARDLGLNVTNTMGKGKHDDLMAHLQAAEKGSQTGDENPNHFDAQMSLDNLFF